MNNAKLKPCPFCSSTNIVIGYFQVWCNDCGCTTEENSTKEEAIDKWNTRKPMDNIAVELEKEKEIAEKEMEKCIFKALPYHDSTEGKVIGIKKAIDIVRKGGVE